MKRLGSILILLLFSTIARSQFYNPGQEPFGTQWMEIKSDSLHLIYPSWSDLVVHDYIKYHSRAWQVSQPDLNPKFSRIPVILHPNSVLSNGFVVWAPKRVELITIPSLDSNSELWLKTLAIHEVRHVLQMQSLNRGVFRVGSWFLGQQSAGIASAMLPRWYMEGDAVYAETKYSHGGRGRQASFYRQYMAVIGQQGSTYNYSKWLLGSYKHYIPNYYSFGYMMVGFTNLKYNSNIWNKALDKTVKRPYYIFSFNISLRQQFKHSLRDHLEESFAYCDSVWSHFEPNEENIYPINVKPRRDKADYIQYQYPHLTRDSLVIALKSSLAAPPKWVLVNQQNRREHTLFKPGYLLSKPFINDSLILWSQYRSGLRWDYKNYSEIWRYDLANNKKARITRKSKLFNPVQLNATQIAAIEVDRQGLMRIAVIDFEGNRVKNIDLERSLEPKELAKVDEQTVLTRCASPNGTVVIEHSVLTGKCDTLLGPIHRDIANVTHAKGALYFTMTDEYREQLFEYDIQNNETSRITHAGYGLGQPSLLSDNQVIASLYSHVGSTPCIIETNHMERYKRMEEYDFPLFIDEGAVETDNWNTSAEIQLVGKKRPIHTGLFNVHSWAPLYYNPSELVKGNIEIYPGATIMSQNLTGTLVSSLGYSYNKTHGVHGYAEWAGWFPKISLGVDYGNRFAYSVGGPNNPPIEEEQRPQLLGKSTVRFPFTLSSGYVQSALNVAAQYQYQNVKVWDSESSSFQNGVHAIVPYISFLAYTRMAHRDIRPNLGISLLSSWYKYPSPNQTLGDVIYSRATLYFPGMLPNHSLMLQGSYEKQLNGQYLNRINSKLIRGEKEFWGLDYKAFSADYALPMLYPDLDILSIFYIKRFIANGFYDYAIGNELVRSNSQTSFKAKRYSSVGMEVTADLHFLRLETPFRVGYRGGYSLHSSSFFHNFVLDINLVSVYGNNPERSSISF